MKKRIAMERIRELFKLFGKIEAAPRIAWQIYLKERVKPLPREIKRSICRTCLSALIPGKTAVVRIRKGRVIVRCLKCGRVYRYPYKPKLQEPRSAKKAQNRS